MRLEVESIRARYISKWSFNSKLVRLEAQAQGRLLAVQWWFQFQIGAIRGAFFQPLLQGCTRFQFQIGAIRGYFPAAYKPLGKMFQFQIGAIRGRAAARPGANRPLCFNSKLVRLEAGRSFHPKTSIGFQFQIGAIRGPPRWLRLVRRLKFQFQIGAIRGRPLVRCFSLWYCSFNSKLVRLEVAAALLG